MKNTKKFTRMATMHAFLQSATMEDLARRTEKLLKDSYPSGVELDVVRETGFTLRRKKDTIITNSELMDTIRDAILELTKENLDDVTDFISDNYEFEYDDSLISTALVEDLFDIDRNGRLIYVEVDV